MTATVLTLMFLNLLTAWSTLCATYLKVAIKVTPLYKKKSKLKVSNYRPMSVLSTVSKLLEKAVYIQVEEYLSDWLDSWVCLCVDYLHKFEANILYCTFVLQYDLIFNEPFQSVLQGSPDASDQLHFQGIYFNAVYYWWMFSTADFWELLCNITFHFLHSVITVHVHFFVFFIL